MNWQNRSIVRFILLLGSLIMVAALLTLFLRHRSSPVRRPSLSTIDEAIRTWAGLDEPQSILQDLSELLGSTDNSGIALSLLKRYRILTLKAQSRAQHNNLLNVYVDRSRILYQKFPERTELLVFFLDSLNQVLRPFSEMELDSLRHISMESISEQNRALLMLVIHKARMDTPENCMELPYGTILLHELAHSDGSTGSVFAINEILVLALTGNIQAALGRGKQLQSQSSIAEELVANLVFDFGSPEEAARRFHELYNREKKQRFALHEADALLKDGKPLLARTIWLDLLQELSGKNLELALYNLGSLATNPAERQLFFRKLLDMQTSHEYALINYSRLLYPEAMDVYLTQSPLYTKSSLIQLEKVKHDLLGTSVYKTGALWLLLNHFPVDDRIYHWAAWYFFRIGNYQELEKLLSMAQENNIEYPSLLLYRAFLAMEQGNLSEAEQLLASYHGEAWYTPANLAKIYEKTYRIPKAIEYYQLAASFVHNPVIASRLYEQVGHCYRKLDKASDARRSYEYALQLNPDNITAAFALQQFDLYR
ncbi:hypothetical protein [Gracilinema caldarium]|uniref:Tetratricopeptide TPR_1 repeat-containing protein n=1 Tax=Gracilinema caldarium (strain ATCC 51460 / DSM 7334 / H1) TaxID=744872 RepID=F8F2G0_GRAC1|nr:hypothetical protein [Gracilinema caldarium]AEJ19075.1 Tetratricopeptide TPR_1 repeat-containing protein [Gracilinema caldarium DSM 7334]